MRMPPHGAERHARNAHTPGSSVAHRRRQLRRAHGQCNDDSKRASSIHAPANSLPSSQYRWWNEPYPKCMSSPDVGPNAAARSPSGSPATAPPPPPPAAAAPPLPAIASSPPAMAAARDDSAAALSRGAPIPEPSPDSHAFATRAAHSFNARPPCSSSSALSSYTPQAAAAAARCAAARVTSTRTQR